jgi:hypothetical protein
MVLLAGLCCLACVLNAQVRDSVRQPKADPDTADMRIRGGERIDFVFTRGLLMRGDLPATYPMEVGRSGSYSLGVALGLPIGRTLAVRFEPRMTWHSVFYSQTIDKIYPTPSNGRFVFEKERGFYAELPIGFKLNLVRNDRNRVRLYLEVGAQYGQLLGSVYKRRSFDRDSLDGSIVNKYTEKFHRISYLNPQRYGLYARMGTKIFAVQFLYRASEIFKADDETIVLPDFSNYEIGLSIVF